MSINDRALALVGRREWALDEQLPYQLPETVGRHGTYRLQLFVGSGELQPIAVVTQMHGDQGSLTAAAAACAEAVWTEFFPDYTQPPIWIERILDDTPGADRPPHLSVVVFAAANDGRRLTAIRWQRLLPEEIDMLAGQLIGIDHGPPDRSPDLQSRYARVLVVLLPQPHPHQDNACMTGETPWARRLYRQLVPRPGGRRCCWYHGGDWGTVSTLAIRLVAQAREENQPIDTFVRRHPYVRSLTGWDAEALHSLFVDPITPLTSNRTHREYLSGTHRAQAMIDAGVRTTLIRRDRPARSSLRRERQIHAQPPLPLGR